MLLYSAAELKNCSDIALKALCENKENCHRRSILRALSSDECSTVPQDTCCNLCTHSCPYTELEYPASSLEVRKRKTRICSIPSQLQNAVREKLIAERDKFIQQHPSFRMVPKSVVCPLSVINDIAFLGSKQFILSETYRHFLAFANSYYYLFSMHYDFFLHPDCCSHVFFTASVCFKKLIQKCMQCDSHWYNYLFPFWI